MHDSGLVLSTLDIKWSVNFIFLRVVVAYSTDLHMRLGKDAFANLFFYQTKSGA